MIVSTIAIAEYCVGGDVHELPLKNIQILPFNLNHSQKTGEFAKIAFQAKNNGILQVNKRVIIPNDTKLFAQTIVKKIKKPPEKTLFDIDNTDYQQILPL